MQTQKVELARLRFPDSRLRADPAKLARHGKFDLAKYTPIIVEQDSDGNRWLMDGVTRVTNAISAGFTHLEAFVFTRN